jgi:nitrite reductase/ring-hydroxylating ferredoxin subunit
LAFNKITSIDQLKNGRLAVPLGNSYVAVFCVDGRYFAIDEICPHKGGPLAEGAVENLSVRCPWHGAIFSLETGAGISGPCGGKVKAYPVRVNGNDLEIDLG